MKKMICVALAMSGAMAFGQGREDFMRQQAYAEMQRVSGQVDVLQSNLNELQNRVGRIEGNGSSNGIRQEIESLKASVADLRREMQSMRGEIVRELAGKISKIQTPAPAPKPEKKTVVIGPHVEYKVQPGDTLSLVAQAFNVSVKKIKEMNGLKSDNLRVGQTLNLPKQ